MSTITREEVNAAVLAYKSAHGHPAMRAMLERAAGVTAISEIPESKFAAVMTAVKQAPGASAVRPKKIDPATIYAKWNRCKVNPERRT